MVVVRGAAAVGRRAVEGVEAGRPEAAAQGGRARFRIIRPGRVGPTTRRAHPRRADRTRARWGWPSPPCRVAPCSGDAGVPHNPIRTCRGELVCVAVCKCGAAEVVRRLAAEGRPQQPSRSPPRLPRRAAPGHARTCWSASAAPTGPRPAHVFGGTGSSGGTKLERKVVSCGVSDSSPCALILSRMRLISSRFTSCTFARSIAW